jgi:cell wall-associated NlpC family hydrolase
LTVTAGIAVVLTPGLAPAAPAAPPATAEQARKAAVDAGAQLREIDEQVHEAEATAEEQEAAADAAGQAAAQAQVAVDALAPKLRAIAYAGYTGSTRSKVAAFLTSASADDLVQRMNTLDQLAAHADGIVAQAAVARDAATEAQAVAAAAAATATEALAVLEGKKDQLEEDLAGYEADFSRLTAADQAKVQTVLAGPTLAAVKPAPAPTAAAGAAVQAALGQLGDRYVPGASGPDAFDCSGLTSYAYAAAGVTLPRSSRAQATIGVPVSRADLQPGDLVFFYTPISHVGMYIGNGQMVHASVPGRPVAVTSVDKGGYVKAVRVVG